MSFGNNPSFLGNTALKTSAIVGLATGAASVGLMYLYQKAFAVPQA